MLENLSSKLGSIISNVKGKYRLSESNIKDILKKFRKSLLEADVAWNVVKHIVNNIKIKLLQMEINKKISPGNIFLKVVNDEFIEILGGKTNNTNFIISESNGLKTILLLGLQGVGKTTSVVKIANYLKKKKKKVLIVSCDIYRPAAIDQLKLLALNAKIDFFNNYTITDSIQLIIKNSLKSAIDKNYDFLIVDSAGRLHIDEYMLDEIKLIHKILNPSFTYLVVDSMVGQDALSSAEIFCKNINISSYILTKMDGDSRGGVLLSLTYTTKKKIQFLCTGENLNDIEKFYPERITSRILGMGDISGLLEDINNKLNNSTDSITQENFLTGSWDLNDFKDQLKNLSKLGNIQNIIEKLPGTFSLTENMKNKINDEYFGKMLAIINSMTLKERKYPKIINSSRKRRIANGSGTNIQAVNNLLKYYEKMKKISQKQIKTNYIFDLFKNKKSL